MGKLIGKLGSVARKTVDKTKDAYGRAKVAYGKGKEVARKSGVALGEVRNAAVTYGERVHNNTQSSNLLTGSWGRSPKSKAKREGKKGKRSKNKNRTIIIIDNNRERGKKRRKQKQSFTLL